MSETTNSVVLALGANLGERVDTLRAAIGEIASLPGVQLEWVSSLVESVALTLNGTDDTAPKYINCVAQIAFAGEPTALLSVLQQIELAHGRVREQRWASRTLDIDIVQFGEIELQTAELNLPHPEASNRNFVLWPWRLADPHASLLGHGRIADLPACNPRGLTVLEETATRPGVTQ